MSLKDYILGKNLGKGSFGAVQIVKKINNNKIYAMKRVKLDKLTEKHKINALNEIRLLYSLKHRNIIGYKESFYDNTSQTLNIVMEYANEGDILNKIKNNLKKKLLFSENTIWLWLIQLLEGINYLHENNIIHRDLKSANVFIGKNNILKIGDLNVSKLLKNEFALTKTGTPYYAAPEIWKEIPYNNKCDIWSAGCIIYEICSLHPPFRGTNFLELCNNICNGFYHDIPNIYSNDLKNILKKMIIVNPLLRWDAKQLLNSDIIQKKIHEIHFNNNCSEKEKKASMMETIKFPININEINKKLPKRNFEKSIREDEMMKNDEYETVKQSFYKSIKESQIKEQNLNSNYNNNNLNNQNINNKPYNNNNNYNNRNSNNNDIIIINQNKNINVIGDNNNYNCSNNSKQNYSNNLTNEKSKISIKSDNYNKKTSDCTQGGEIGDLNTPKKNNNYNLNDNTFKSTKSNGENSSDTNIIFKDKRNIKENNNIYNPNSPLNKNNNSDYNNSKKVITQKQENNNNKNENPIQKFNVNSPKEYINLNNNFNGCSERKYTNFPTPDPDSYENNNNYNPNNNNNINNNNYYSNDCGYNNNNNNNNNNYNHNQDYNNKNNNSNINYNNINNNNNNYNNNNHHIHYNKNNNSNNNNNNSNKNNNNYNNNYNNNNYNNNNYNNNNNFLILQNKSPIQIKRTNSNMNQNINKINSNYPQNEKIHNNQIKKQNALPIKIHPESSNQRIQINSLNNRQNRPNSVKRDDQIIGYNYNVNNNNDRININNNNNIHLNQNYINEITPKKRENEVNKNIKLLNNNNKNEFRIKRTPSSYQNKNKNVFNKGNINFNNYPIFQYVKPVKNPNRIISYGKVEYQLKDNNRHYNHIPIKLKSNNINYYNNNPKIFIRK